MSPSRFGKRIFALFRAHVNAKLRLPLSPARFILAVVNAVIRTPAEIEQLAAKAGKSMLQVCREAQIAPSTWTRWKAGQTSPTLNNYLRIAAAVEELTA
jgi:hypothetical protein